MTTVCYRSKVLAADTRSVTDDIVERGNFRKVYRLSSGILIGTAGDLAVIQDFIRQMKKKPNVTPIVRRGVMEAIMVLPSGKVYEFDTTGWIEGDAEFHAVGSGRIPALVAMHCGKSAAQAVKIAMLFDRNTGGKVQTVRLT